MTVGFASNGHAGLACDADDAAGSASHTGDTNGDGQGDSTAAIDLLYLQKRFEFAAPLLELGRVGFVPDLDEAAQNASAAIFPHPIPFLPSAGVCAARAGLMPRAPAVV